jgi:hypothetical protein
MPADADFYAGEVERELALAARCPDRAGKAVHLNRASQFATLRERAARASSATAGTGK